MCPSAACCPGLAFLGGMAGATRQILQLRRDFRGLVTFGKTGQKRKKNGQNV